jgi:ABC-type sugar transport system ATPase subunit
LGAPLARFGFLSRRAMRSRYAALCDEMGVRVQPPRVPAGTLSVADQQVLEIMRALVRDSRLIVFDEPTASLALAEREAFYRLTARLRERGLTVVFVSHNLDEVLMLADEITVFREGILEESSHRSDWTKPRLVRSMLGEKADPRVLAQMLEAIDDGPRETRAPDREHRGGRVLLRIRALTVPGAIENVDFEVKAGEILGIAGLVGSGRSTLLRALAGSESTARGSLTVEGRDVPWPTTVRKAQTLGVALLPEDRKSQGLALNLPAMDNIALGDPFKAATRGIVSRQALERAVSNAAEDVGFPLARLRTRTGNLSGGNQQKLLVARWTYAPPKVLLVDEPTRGIDIGAKAEVTQALGRMARSGMGIVFVSSELEEVVAVSDRILVVVGGRIVDHLDGSKGAVTVPAMLHSMFELGEPR